MTARTALTERRAAERTQTKETPRTRAEINLANAQKSTGPKTAEGKERASRNSFKHGLYSKLLVCANEDPAELDTLRASLRSEHQPVNTNEEILVNELAENFWRLRRMRAFEGTALEPDNVYGWMNHGLLALVQRTMVSAERSYYKALTTLRQLQKDRGFVPQIAEASIEADSPAAGFVPRKEAELVETHRVAVAQTSTELEFAPGNDLRNSDSPDPIQDRTTVSVERLSYPLWPASTAPQSASPGLCRRS